jgi:autotransporter-associated beta strand protein/T5SS/PEP-CTERM-associated repeat protein
MEGSGTLILGGTNTYTGGTMLQGGVVSLASSGAIGASGPIEFNGGTLQYTGANTDDYSGRIVSVNSRPISIDTNGESVTYLTGLTGAGTTLEKLGAGTLTLSGSSSYDGGTTVGGGTLEVSASGVINHAGADLVVGGVDNGTLLVDGGQVSVFDANLGDTATTGTVRVEVGSFSSAGTVRIGNGSDATGAFEVAGGTVTTAATVIGESGGTGSATVSGGTWTNSGNLDVNNGAPGTLTISGGTLAVGGTLTELSPNSIELQNGGELRIGTGGTGGSLDADLNFAGSLVFNRASASTYGRTLAGTGTLTKQGSGTLTLSAAGTYSYSGPTTVSAGGLVIDGTLDNSFVTVASGGLLGGEGSVANQVTVASGGVIDPGAFGDPGVLTIGTLTLQDGSRASFGILGDGNLAGTAGTDYDQLNVTGALTLSGTLRLDFSNPAAFAAGQEFELFNLVSLSGSPVSHFSEVIAAGTGVYTGLTFTRTADLWTSTLTAAGQSLRFSETTGKLVVVAVVPEPSTWGMLLAGGAAVVLVRGRRRFQKTLGM